MYNEKEYERVYDHIWTLNNIKKTILDNFNDKWNVYEAMNKFGFELESVEDVESNLSTIIRRDLLLCYFELGYPQYYNEKTYEMFNLLSHALISEENYILYGEYKKYCTSPYFKTLKEIHPKMFDIIKPLALNSPGVIVLYAILKSINSIDDNLYFDAIKSLASILSENKKFVKSEGLLWLKKLSDNPDSFCFSTSDEYKIKEDEQISNSITRDYYDYLEKVINELGSFLNIDLLTSHSFKNYLFTHQILGQVLTDEDRIDTFIRTFLIKDICEIYKTLGHSINFDTIEGKVLFLALMKCNNFEYDYEAFNYMCDFLTQNPSAINAREKCTELLRSSYEMNINIGLEGLILKQLLEASDTDLSKKYMVILYRISSAVAKADGKITEDESRWLSQLVAQTGVDESKLEEKKESRLYEEKPNPIEELETLIGLSTVKKDVVSLANFIKMKQMREAKGLKTPAISYHCVFTGNPGTGKTTVARILASIFKELGILKSGHLVETDRAGLVAEYVGQTAVKTNKIIDSALDGVLFVDEAYTLIGGQNDYGKEAIATLLKRMEDDRDRLIVILAGYSNEMEEFINSNPGLRSRFNRYIYFPDYSASELYDIFQLNVNKNEYEMTDEANQYLEDKLKEVVARHQKDFGNARYVRNFFEMVIEHQANRLAYENDLSADKISELTIDDVKIDVKQNIQGLNNIGF